MQLALIKNEYLEVYREHSVFVEKYEEKLKRILKREAQISEFQMPNEVLKLFLKWFQCHEECQWKKQNNFLLIRKQHLRFSLEM